jgi:hypothetical protein
MKTLYLLLFLLIPCSIFSCEKAELTDNEKTGRNQESEYYINTQDDFDEWNGFNFPEGSKVLFATGKTFTGQFVLLGSGSKTKPNLAAAYDPKSGEMLTEWTDNKPVIHGGGKVNSALLLRNGEFWEINNIEVTNSDGTTGDQGDLRGIYVTAENSGTMENITIKNCYVHDVNGKVGGKMRGGIHVHVLGDSVKTKFHNLLIDNNVVKNVGGVGIGNQSSWPNIDTEDYYPWTNFVIRNNRVERTGRNGIIVRYSINPLVEYNVLAYNSRYSTGHSVFNFNTIGCIVQYNEAYGNTSANPDDIDHGGFDADYNSRGTIIQYNYSHDNNWFCGIMRRGINTDVTIRYNISQNELLGAYLYGFPKETGVKDVKVYNNTHYFGKGKGNRIFVAAGKVRVPTETTFSNNIFYFEDEAEWGFEPDNTCIFKNNLYYNVTPKGEKAITADPLFVNPGSGGTNIDMRYPQRLSGYKLKENSPAIGAGVPVKENGGSDFWGNSLYSSDPDIGAHEQ